MKVKKFLAVTLSGACILAGAAFAGCSSKNDDNKNAEIYAVYQTYVTYAEGRGDTPLNYEQWLESIKGADGKDGTNGKDGKSAYEIWLEAGNEGTEEDFLNFLKTGEKGDAGSHVVSAKQVYADRWKIAYYFEFGLSDGSTVTTEETAIVTVDPAKTYEAHTEEEREILRGYGVQEDKIKYAPVFDPEIYRFAAPLGSLENILMAFGEFYWDTVLNRGSKHFGTDFGADAGDSVYAGRDGVIEEIDDRKITYGLSVTIKHADGLSSVYDCIDIKEGLSVGDSVRQGEVIGTVALNTTTSTVTVRNAGTVESLAAEENGVTAIVVAYTITHDVIVGDGVTETETETIRDTYKVTASDSLPEVGSDVAAGNILGTYTSLLSASESNLGAHLHFNLLVNGESVKPYAFLGIEEPAA